MMKIVVFISTLIFIVQCTYAFPRTTRNLGDDDLLKSKNLAGISSQIIATNLLKDKIDYNGNQVFSPLGISTLLAILSEGARDNVYKEFVTTLGYPDDKKLLRESFKNVLKNFRKDLNQLQSPSFKTWFYIYRNNTVKDEFKQILRDCYFVEIKDVDRYLSSAVDESKSLLDKEKISDTLFSTSSSTVAPSTSSFQFELEKEISSLPTVLPFSISTSVNSKDIQEFDSLKKSKPTDETKHEVDEQKDASKFDEIVEDKQYVEVPVIKEEISAKENQELIEKMKNEKVEEEKKKVEVIERQKENENEQEESIDVIKQNVSNMKKEKFIRDDHNDKQEIKDVIKPNIVTADFQSPSPPLVMVAESEASESLVTSFSSVGEQNLQDNEAIKDDEKLEAYKKDIVDNKQPAVVQISDDKPEKFSIPLKKLEESEIIRALENHFLKKRFSGGRALFQKDDVASALSANSLVGRELPAQTRMLLFNGLYYRGNWAYPFKQSKSGENDDNDDLFYVNEDKKIPVTMMKAEGKYRIADLERLNAKAIEFPYENQKYSLLILLPNEEKSGLRSLLERFEARDLLEAKSNLAESLVKVCLPRFSTELTSRSEETLKRLGLKTLFSPDLGGLEDISEGVQLNVDEIVQHVNLRVDEGAGSQNILAATALESRSSDQLLDNVTRESENLNKADDEVKNLIKINRPFLYFILDNENDFIIVAGKVFEPKIPLSDF